MIPTPRLLLLALVTVPLLVGGTVAPPLLLLALVYALAVAGMATADLVLSPRPGDLAVTRHHDGKLSLGVDNLVTLQLANAARRPLRCLVRDEAPGAFLVDQVFLAGEVPARGATELSYRVKPQRRGDYAFGRVNVRYDGVLGLVQRQHAYRVDGRVKVYPNLLEVRKYELLARRGSLQEAGLRNARRFGTGTEFERLRDYEPDDDYRRINWKATARRHRPICNEYEPERSQTIVVLLDVGRMMTAPIGPLVKVDYAINTALMLAFVGSARGDQVGLLTFADQVGAYLPPRRGKRQFYAMIEALYDVEPQLCEPGYRAAFQYLAVKQKKRALVVLFTDLMDAETSRTLVTYLGHLVPRHLPVCVTMSDPQVFGPATAFPLDSQALYEKAVAQKMIQDRREVLERLGRRGVVSVDVPADKLTAAVVNKYLELKARTML